jgi:nucleoside-diphosphate-sugar epimerase
MNSEHVEVKRILVTGGAGFLGSNLCDSLLAQGHEVICLDNFHTGRRNNVAHLLANPSFSILEHDVTNPSSCGSTRSTTSRAPRHRGITSTTRSTR